MMDGGRELKWVLSARRAPLVGAWLARRLRPDPGYPVGWVHSIYYDTPTWRFLGEKVNSDLLKTKVRLRWYKDAHGVTQGDAAFLEIKRKEGGQRRKLRMSVDLSLAGSPLDDPRLLRVLAELHEPDASLPGPLFPLLHIAYRRARYIEPRTDGRIALDDHIRVVDAHPRYVPSARRPHLQSAVLEVKGISELPTSMHFVHGLGCSRRAFSKYLECHALLTGVSQVAS